MENKLDKLFRDKLEHHSVQPSAQAWEKVAAGFPKKNNTIVWAWRIAAAIALVGTVSLLIINSWSGESESTMANESTKENTEQVKPAETKKTELIQEKQQEPVQQETTKSKQTVAPKVFNRPVEQPVAEAKEEAIQTQNDSIAVTAIESVTNQTTEIPGVTKTTSTTQEKTLVIVYSLAPVESKPAVEEPVKTKPLQRMLTFAKDVKGGETTLASVRNWKDNFLGNEETTRTEKQTSNN